MESPTASTTTTTGELREPIRGCSLSSIRINREDLKRKLMMPKYLRIAVLDSILSRDAAALANWYLNGAEVNGALEQRPEGPVVVFVNSKSGGHHGPELEERLQQLMGEEQM